MLTKLTCLMLIAAASVYAQDVTITNARIVVANGTVIENGSIVVRGGKIVSVAQGAPSAAAGQTIDAKGMTAMPGFIVSRRDWGSAGRSFSHNYFTSGWWPLWLC